MKSVSNRTKECNVWYEILVGNCIIDWSRMRNIKKGFKAKKNNSKN